MPDYLTNIFQIGLKQCPIKFLLYPEHLPFFDLVSRIKTFEVGYREHTRKSFICPPNSESGIDLQAPVEVPSQMKSPRS